jgi:hypothetical protein
MPALALAATFVIFPAAYAAPPVPAPANQAAGASVDAAAASHSARAGELIGSNCSYTTGMMARRVLEEGEHWEFEGALSASSNNLGSMVASPFTTQGGVNVIANELVELISHGGHTHARLSLIGKLLEVDGVRYVVLTSFKVINA